MLLSKNKTDLITVLELKRCYKKVIKQTQTVRLSSNFAKFLPSELCKTSNMQTR